MVGAYQSCHQPGVQTADHQIRRNGWDTVSRTASGGYFAEELSVALEERVDPDTLVFEAPSFDSRYDCSDAIVRDNRDRYAIFAKTGGPFKRASFLRGYMNFLIDFAEDPEWV